MFMLCMYVCLCSVISYIYGRIYAFVLLLSSLRTMPLLLKCAAATWESFYLTCMMQSISRSVCNNFILGKECLCEN